MKPNVEPSAGSVLDNMNIPATNVTIATLSTRAIGSLSVAITTPSATATDAASVRSDNKPDRKETAGESRPTRNTKYMLSPRKGMRSVISRSSAITEASTMRSELLQRPGVGSRSCWNRSIHAETIVATAATSRQSRRSRRYGRGSDQGLR